MIGDGNSHGELERTGGQDVIGRISEINVLGLQMWTEWGLLFMFWSISLASHGESPAIADGCEIRHSRYVHDSSNGKLMVELAPFGTLGTFMSKF